MNFEEWKELKNSKGKYFISNYGRVKNSNGLILKQRFNKDGYKRISLQVYQDGKKKLVTYFVHRLVAEYFVENDRFLPFVNHLDEDKVNNHFSNLEWCTKKRNNTYNNKISSLHVNQRRPRKVIDVTNGIIYESMGKAAKANNVTTGAIYNCCTGQNKTSNQRVFLFYEDFLVTSNVI